MEPTVVRNMKHICNLLHEARRTGVPHAQNINDLILTAELVYHEIKDGKR